MIAPASAIPSQFARDFDRILIDCHQAPTDLKQPLCAAIGNELLLRLGKPVVNDGDARSSDLVVHVRAEPIAGANVGNLELSMWLSRPAGRSGEPVTRPAKTRIVQMSSAPGRSELRSAVAPIIQAMLGRRPMQQAPSPPRAD